MIQTINPYAAARTAEIMSKYRPIAPKPEKTNSSMADNNNIQNGSENENMPLSISKSAYLRDVWAHLQERPTRTRKRGRTAAFPPPPVKRSRGPCSSFQGAFISTAKNLVMHGFSLVPIIKCAVDDVCRKGIDLNMEADECCLEEIDFMPQLNQPVTPNIIKPKPVRPIGSRIVVNNISDDKGPRHHAAAVEKRLEEVEKEIEEDSLPAIISDCNNKVRVTNSAYKEMVGQPECCWLDYCCGCKRIGGEVLLQFCGDSEIMSMHDGFTCQVKIVWEKRCVDGFCDVVKLGGFQEKNYRLLWRFHTAAGESFKCGTDGGDST